MTWTDEELVARSIRGDSESFNELILRWERPIYSLAYRTIGREEDARDVCQETFLRAFRALPAFRGQAKFSSWLYRIALNLCRDWMRRERRAPVVQAPEDVDLVELAAAAEPSESIEDLVARKDLTRAVERVMARLPEEQRTAIILEGIPRPDVSGDCRPRRMPAEHRENSLVPGAHRPSARARQNHIDEHGYSSARISDTREEILIGTCTTTSSAAAGGIRACEASRVGRSSALRHRARAD